MGFSSHQRVQLKISLPWVPKTFEMDEIFILTSTTEKDLTRSTLLRLFLHYVTTKTIPHGFNRANINSSATQINLSTVYVYVNSRLIKNTFEPITTRNIPSPV